MNTKEEIIKMKDDLVKEIQLNQDMYNHKMKTDPYYADHFEKQVIRYTAQYNILLKVLGY